MTDFLGAKESLLEDLDDLLMVLVLDLVDLRAEGAADTTDEDDEEGFAHCFMVFRRNLLFSFCVPNPDGLCPSSSLSFLSASF